MNALAEAENLACEAAFDSVPNVEIAWCCHHGLRLEILTSSPMKRILYIMGHKDRHEWPTRFRNFRPVRVKLNDEIQAALKTYHIAFSTCPAESGSWICHCSEALRTLQSILQHHDAELTQLHNQDWPTNTWRNGTIFNEIPEYKIQKEVAAASAAASC